ncbi:MAG: class I SAM-dependent methyltransferase [Hyphomicrobiales bacterium]|nr:MAG: class I SAM-dependent methyltransferase [Hyphomicrobiales bacterium]
MSVSSTFLATDGGGYEAQMGRWSRRLAPLLVDFSRVSSGSDILDAGCGTGSLTAVLAENPNVCHVTGVDLSAAYVQYANLHCATPRATFEIGDITRLRFGAARFDHAFSSLVLQFVPEPDRAVRELRRVTRSGGTVAAATWDTRGGLIVHRMFFDTAAVIDPNAGRHRALACTRGMSRRDGLIDAWSRAGLVDVETGSLTIRMEYGSFHDFWSSIDGHDGPYASYLATLANDTRQTLLELVEAAYLDGAPDGPRSYAATAWCVRGRVP